MSHHLRNRENGFSLVELCIMFAGGLIITATAVPAFHSVMNSFRLTMAAEAITTELQFARMKAVSSNEVFSVNFTGTGGTYQVETGPGTVIAGPFQLPTGISLNNSEGAAITFGGNIVSFSPTGTVPATGSGSAGRVKIQNQQGAHIDVVVTVAGAVRQTPVYKTSTAAF